ncbi:MAG: damage-inducible protein, partial [Pseudonocardiaceae bacterium]
MPDISDTDARLRVLGFWSMTELFSPQPIPKPTGRSARSGDRQVIEWRPGQRLPWEHRKPPPRRGKQELVWRHQVYLGVYETEATYQFLHGMFHEDADAYDERPGGRSACAAVVLDQDGRFLDGSAVLSAALWAVGRLRSPGPVDPGWARGFDQTQKRLVEAVGDYEADRREAGDSDESIPHDAVSVAHLTMLAQRSAAITDVPALATEVVLISSTAVPVRRSEVEVENDFLNSFYLDDLERVRARVAAGDIGEALATYLRPKASLAVRDRVDVRQHPEVIDQATSITRLPKGRWPAKADHPLALSQQYAVNTALNTLGSTTGLIGVNGPPGTGKTTLA